MFVTYFQLDAIPSTVTDPIITCKMLYGFQNMWDSKLLQPFNTVLNTNFFNINIINPNLLLKRATISPIIISPGMNPVR